jgi:hypothetical protein
VARNLFPYAVLLHKSIGAENRLGTVFAPHHAIISVRVGRNRGVVVDTDLEIADLLAVHLVVVSVFCLRQEELLCRPNPTAEAASPIVRIIFSTKDESPARFALTASFLKLSDCGDRRRLYADP